MDTHVAGNDVVEDLHSNGLLPHQSTHELGQYASLAEKRRLWQRNAVINTLFIGAWFFFATILSVYNKWMFSADRFGFPYPLFVTTLQMFIQSGLAAMLRYGAPKHFKPEHNPTKKDYGTKVVPTAIATGLDIGLSNVSLKTITLAFYTMCKSSSLIFVLIFAFMFKLETFSFRLVGVISLIFIGVVLMVATQTEFVLVGFILVMSASALGGFRWSLTQLLLKNKEIGLNNPASTIFWLAPVMGVALGIISLILEGWPSIFRTHFFATWPDVFSTSLYLIAPGIVAFCMVMSEFYILKRAGVVPMSIAGIAKEVTTISISAWFFGDQLTPLNIVGVSITMCGIALFTYHKYRKSIDSPLPLDIHGNPIPPDDMARQGNYVELPNRPDREGSSMYNDGDTESARMLFEAGEDEDDDDASELRSITSTKIRQMQES